MSEALRQMPTVADIERDPSRAVDLTPSEAAALMPEAGARVGAAQGALAALAARAMNAPGDGAEPDEAVLVSVDEAARLAGVPHDAILRRVQFRPAVVRLGHVDRKVNVKRLRRILERDGA